MANSFPRPSEALFTVLIAGYSTRAAAWSVIRAGGVPVLFDACQDVDLPRGTLCDSFEEFLDSLSLSERNEIPFLLTGGWENRAKQLKLLAAQHPIWGPDLSSINQVRDPQKLQEKLKKAGFPSLRIRTSASANKENNDPGVSWIRKSFASMGGLETERVLDDSLPSAEFYDQQYCGGTVYSAQFLTKPGQPSATEFLGLMLQVAGSKSVPDRPYIYSGNIGPISEELVERRLIDQTRKLGEFIAAHFHLRGLWGIDLIDTGSELFVIEVNPRYTAAIELIELTRGRALIAEAWGIGNSGRVAPHKSKSIIGKRIVYAPESVTISAPLWDSHLSPALLSGWDRCWEIPTLSDIPHPETQILRGMPICTVWALAGSIEQCEIELKIHEQQILKLLFPG